MLATALLDQAFELVPLERRTLLLALTPLLGALVLLFPPEDEAEARRTGLNVAAQTLVWLIAMAAVYRRALAYELFGAGALALFGVMLWGLLRYYRRDEADPPAGRGWPAAGLGLFLLAGLVFLVGGPAEIVPVILGGGLLFFASGFIWSFLIYPADELDWLARAGLAFALCLGVQPVAFVYLARLGMGITPVSIVAVCGALSLLGLAALGWRRGRVS